MATIKQIDDRTVHQIQSGQVIVDLCSVVKELVENSIDATATSIDVRFKNQGLDLIEVQDNGSGISPENHPSVALKHHTSKLSSYSDIASLETFGFRGEALASLCALSFLSVTTCLAKDVPKGSKLGFEASGKLNGSSVVAAQRGTTVSVENLFHNLPVRRRELERNIKREWHKVIALLNQYACIQTNLKFTVSQQPTKGKRILLFSTKGNLTTRDNIINIFGAKTMTSLVPLELKLEMRPSTVGQGPQHSTDLHSSSKEVHIIGHVSRPTHGDGRQTPDRQMFFVNGRPCGLPQFARIFNEVYRSYNSGQTPFIMADIQLDTHMYDVNVSPDKRSILLHDQSDLLDTLRSSLVELFDSQDYVVPTSQLLKTRQSSDRGKTSYTTMPSPKPTTLPAPPPVRPTSGSDIDCQSDSELSDDESPDGAVPQGRATIISGARSVAKHTTGQNLISRWVERKTNGRPTRQEKPAPGRSEPLARGPTSPTSGVDQLETEANSQETTPEIEEDGKPRPVKDFNKRLAESTTVRAGTSRRPADRSSPSSIQSPPRDESPIPAVSAVSTRQDNFVDSIPSQLRCLKTAPAATTITIGDSSMSALPESPLAEIDSYSPPGPRSRPLEMPNPSFGGRLSHLFSASSKGREVGETEEGLVGDDNESDTSSGFNSPHESEKSKKGSTVPAELATADIPLLHTSTTSRMTPANGDDGTETEAVEMLSESSELAEVSYSSVAPELQGQPPKIGIRKRDSTLQIAQHLRIDEDMVRSRMTSWGSCDTKDASTTSGEPAVADLSAADAEEKLSLIISRSDFSKMKVAGQFNLGFIIAIRLAAGDRDDGEGPAEDDELFIIDQHATDEKYNFERLQATTVVQSQRLVQPKRLELTALEEEIVMQNMEAIEANGFKIRVDMSGDEPVGSRCQLLALPLSREITFTLTDLEELISLLGEESAESKHIPRPSKVRKMFAMRACRSSIMIGKALTQGKMETLVRHMGELDKPWNCPHGRPTMRHLCKLQPWDERGWNDDRHHDSRTKWRKYMYSD
ncbi:hypothetical protein G7046_g4695 [Stylonectria norvegica]|nr:hypothetical protein G7046_g4695 [Stylonectria norvegica]